MTELTRRQHDRAGDKYARDLTDAEWGVLAALMPPCRTTGRPRTTDLRQVSDAILTIATTGCQTLSRRFPRYGATFHGWRNDGLLDEMNRKLAEAARLAADRKARPTAGIIDPQSVKTTESGGGRGSDVGKRIKGRKRHIVTDRIGLLIGLEVASAGIQDLGGYRDGAPDVLAAGGARYPMLRHILADGGYAGPRLRDALQAIGRWTVQIVKRCDTAEGFTILPRRWVARRTLAWLRRCRHLSKDREKSIASAEASVAIAHIRRITRHLARMRKCSVGFESDLEAQGPRGEHIVALVRHSDEVLGRFLAMAGREDLMVAIQLAVAEEAIADLLDAVRQLDGDTNQCGPNGHRQS